MQQEKVTISYPMGINKTFLFQKVSELKQNAVNFSFTDDRSGLESYKYKFFFYF